MVPAPFRVLLDANVLYPFTLRDTLLRAAAAGMFRVLWSQEILDETTRNLVAAKRMTEAQAARLTAMMATAFPQAEVTDFQALIDAMPNDPKDRHVAAAAVKGGAQVIVTQNLKDFRTLPEGLEAESPDDFLRNLLGLYPDEMVELLRQQASALKRPPLTFDDVLAGLATTVPRFVAAVRERLA